MKKHSVNPVVIMAVALTLVLLPIWITSAQEPDSTFYLGVDLSYVNEMEDCNAVYRENGEPRDPFALFAEHGATLVRARLWHNPDWTDYSTVPDIKRTFSRAVEAGMSTLLDIHYSDNWADPSRQEIPAEWEGLDDDELVEAVYDYTSEILTELASENLVPAFVQIGNETNSGILTGEGGPRDWSRDARLFNAGIRAVRDFTAETGSGPRIILHVAQPENTDWWFREAEAVGITDFDVIGVSYYPQWSTFSIGGMGAQVSHLRQRFGKDVMVLETAYGWTRDAVDETASNILTQGIRGYPFSPEGQRRFMTDLSQSLISNGAIGVVYWEPAWVSTQCFTRWGQGSHWENATLFDFQNNNEPTEGIQFLSAAYQYPDELVDGVVEVGYGDLLIQDDTADVLNDVAALDLAALYARASENSISLALTVAGDVYAERGSYLIYFDTTGDTQGATTDVGRRPITVADPFKPEFRLDIAVAEANGSASAEYVLNAWVEGEWTPVTFVGGAAISSGETSVIELQLPRTLLGDPQVLNIAALSTGRGRIHTASDTAGTSVIPTDESSPLVLDAFFEFELPD